MFHSEFAALQCLSFWYPSSADYGRRQYMKISFACTGMIIKSLQNFMICHMLSWWYPTGSTLNCMEGSCFSQRFIHPGYSCLVEAQVWIARERYCKLYVFFLKRNWLFSFFMWNTLFGLSNSVAFYRTVCYYETVHAYMYKHLFVSFGIIGLKINNQTYKRLKRESWWSVCQLLDLKKTIKRQVCNASKLRPGLKNDKFGV